MIGDTNCKAILDSGSCINTISSKVIKKDGLKMVPYSHSYKVPWTNSTVPGVQQPCLVPIAFIFTLERLFGTY